MPSPNGRNGARSRSGRRESPLDAGLNGSGSRESVHRGSSKRDPASGNDARWSSYRTKEGAGHDMEGLAELIQGEVLPRLMLLHDIGESYAKSDTKTGNGAGNGVDDGAEGGRSVEPTFDDIAFLAETATLCDYRGAMDHVRGFQDRGCSLATIFLRLLAPAARLLGDYWTEDRRTFTEVTVGLTTLQQLLRELGPEFGEIDGLAWHGRKALIVPTPGEQHTFGLLMVAEFFRRAGWDVTEEVPRTNQELAALARAGDFDLVGFSLSGESLLESLTSCIATLRRATRDKAVSVLVGGHLFVEHPELVSQVGADIMAVDGQDGVDQADALFVRSNLDVSTDTTQE